MSFPGGDVRQFMKNLYIFVAFGIKSQISTESYFIPIFPTEQPTPR